MPPQETKVPSNLRQAFADVGARMPDLWPQLSMDAKRSLIHPLIQKVNLLRDSEGVAHIRIVWHGELVTEIMARVPIHPLKYSENEKRVAERIRKLTAGGATHEAIISDRFMDKAPREVYATLLDEGEYL